MLAKLGLKGVLTSDDNGTFSISCSQIKDICNLVIFMEFLSKLVKSSISKIYFLHLCNGFYI